jgi:Fe-S-cluster containining protein
MQMEETTQIPVISACQRCGKCCGLIVQIEESDVKRIKEATELDEVDFVLLVNSPSAKDAKIMKRAEGSVDRKHPGKHCVFLRWNDDDTTYCEIYDSRPDVCRSYPTHVKCPAGWQKKADPTKV